MNLKELKKLISNCLNLQNTNEEQTIMRKVHFLPWVGKNYLKGIDGRKVMALGESHYCGRPEDDTTEITNDVILCYLDSANEFEGWMNTYTKFIKALSGEEISRESSALWWNKILFYNYVQVPMSGPRVAPIAQEFRNSDDAFFEVLEQFQPDCIIAWGKRLYDNLPHLGTAGEDVIAPDGAAIETWNYTLRTGHIVQVLPITHPSAGFATDYWGQIIQTFIKR